MRSKQQKYDEAVARQIKHLEDCWKCGYKPPSLTGCTAVEQVKAKLGIRANDYQHDALLDNYLKR